MFKGKRFRKLKLFAATLIGCAAVAAVVAVLVATFLRAQEARHRQICANNLRQIGVAFKMYAEDWDGRYPQSQIDDRNPDDIKVTAFFFNGRAMFPEYLKDASPLVCPSDSGGVEAFESGCWNLNGDPTQPFVPESFSGLSYVYFPWVTTSDEEFEAMAMYVSTKLEPALALTPPNLEAVGRDMILLGTGWEGKGNAGGDSLYRLREGIGRFLITDIEGMPGPGRGARPERKIPVMMDWICAYTTRVYTTTDLPELPELPKFPPNELDRIPGGANVLFLDGHVEFLKYLGGYPVTPQVSFYLSDI